MSGFTARVPTWKEVNDHNQLNCTHVVMTSDAEWLPHDPKYKRREQALRDELGQKYDLRLKGNRYVSPLQVQEQPPLVENVSDDDSSASSDGGEDDMMWDEEDEEPPPMAQLTTSSVL
jgi:hypothetical protein